jgi:RNA polymerase sigma factor (sigma-70 family)
MSAQGQNRNQERMAVNDHQLMTAVREGDSASLGQLFNRHHRKLYNYFLKHVGNRPASEDLVQDVFLRILKYRRTYADPEGGFEVWLYTIARNVRFDYYRRKAPRALPIEEMDGIEDNAPGPHDSLETAEEIGLIRQALDSLSESDREVIVMSRYQGMKYREIGLVLGCTEGAIKVKIFRALKQLAEKFHTIKSENIHEL